jgi:hypothetical protein
MKGELGWMPDEAIVAYLQVLAHNFHGGAE